ncbi:hypothetical protein E3P92_01173 [Wallemia ichthyophaga]|nr:hypothetical protein E3P91_00880 [Wallemia ichthyophaga]TIA83150.1 hypothetical protein E3P98_01026 [Wallemia ichthyophaga]TIA92053.1 hypothetical protein E3P97_01713 [Wallemia ichthyophaga]TIB02051.1 hypothetical protein E3P95_01120 [Wallemia ichthyophaga]TIB02886.1 hypothetical protein E3P94_01252 [Wallemia ichthyophaga]
MSDLSAQDEFANKLEPPPEARELGAPKTPSILRNSKEGAPRKMSADGVSFAPLPQRPASMPRRNSITLGVAARSSFFNGGGNSGNASNIHRNSDGSLVKTFTAQEWKEMEQSQEKNVVDLGDVAVDAGKRLVRLFRRGENRDVEKGKNGDKNKNKIKDKDKFMDKQLEDVGEQKLEEEDQDDQDNHHHHHQQHYDTDSSIGTLSPNTSHSHVSQSTADTSHGNSSVHARTSFNDLHPYKRGNDEQLKDYALGFDPDRLKAKREQM